MRKSREEGQERAVLEALRKRLEGDSFGRLLGIHITDLEEGFARLEMKVQPEMVNFLSIIHGGAIFSLADHAFAAACNSHGIPAVALHLDITFFSVPSPGSTLTAEAREVYVSRRTGTYQIEIATEGGRRVASCQGIAFRKVQGDATHDDERAGKR